MSRVHTNKDISAISSTFTLIFTLLLGMGGMGVMGSEVTLNDVVESGRCLIVLSRPMGMQSVRYSISVEPTTASFDIVFAYSMEVSNTSDTSQDGEGEGRGVECSVDPAMTKDHPTSFDVTWSIEYSDRFIYFDEEFKVILVNRESKEVTFNGFILVEVAPMNSVFDNWKYVIIGLVSLAIGLLLIILIVMSVRWCCRKTAKERKL